jgi:hypothetical protein
MRLFLKKTVEAMISKKTADQAVMLA